MVCKELGEIPTLKNVFAVKFKYLVEWRPDLGETKAQFNNIIKKERQDIINYLREEYPECLSTDIYKLKYEYSNLNYKLFNLKKNIIRMLNEWDEMIPNTTKTNEKGHLSNVPSKFRLASKRKTDFLKIISALYDCRMFETEDGYIANNKQELISEFGRLLSEDFTKYSASLSQSKQVTKETFLKPFTDIRKKAEEYYDK